MPRPSRSARLAASIQSSRSGGAKVGTRLATHQPERMWVWTCTVPRRAYPHGFLPRGASALVRSAAVEGAENRSPVGGTKSRYALCRSAEDEPHSLRRVDQVHLHADEQAGRVAVDQQGDAVADVHEIDGGAGLVVGEVD